MITFTFTTPWDADKTREAIEATVLSIGGKVKKAHFGELKAKWKAAPSQLGGTNACTFYVGDGSVRAVTNTGDIKIIDTHFPLWVSCMRFWNTFIEQLVQRYPDVDFGVRPGDLELVAVQVVGDDQVYVTKSKGVSPLGGAIIGDALFGEGGAVIGALWGAGHKTETSVSKFSNSILVKVRYSNGFINEGTLMKKSRVYQEIMANMAKLSKRVDSY